MYTTHWSIFPPFPLGHSFHQVAIIIILQVSQCWHVCYRQTTKDHDSPLSQNLSIANNSALKNRAWWVPPSMAYCQQGSACNYSCDCKVASDAEDTTYQPFTLSSGSNILSGPSSATFPEFCLVLLMLNSREETSNTVIAYFSYTLQLRCMVVCCCCLQCFYLLILVGSQEGWQEPALFGGSFWDLLYLKQGLETHQLFRVTLLSFSFVILYLGNKTASFHVAFLYSHFLGYSSHSTAILSSSHPTSCSPSLLKPPLPKCPHTFLLTVLCCSLFFRTSPAHVSFLVFWLPQEPCAKQT